VPRPGILLGVLLAVTLLAAGCAEQAGPGAGDDSPSSSPLGPDASPQKPSIVVPDGPPPTELVIQDLVEGTGPPAGIGNTLVVHYVGVAYSTGVEFDASWDRGQPFPVTLGSGGVIPGWEQGLMGLKAGGRRQLTIPPDLAYGEQGRGPDIGPNETLIFVIDLLELS
jgi:peptidylprolyl isomerase